MSAVAVVSGGMDSSTLVYHMRERGIEEIYGIGFNYGQRHVKELDFAMGLVSDGLLADYTVVNLAHMQQLLGRSVLTDHHRDVPDGHYAEDNMKQTVVPNRNMIMLSIAVGYAVTLQAAEGVWTGVHAGDHFIYPDCRPEFIEAADQAAFVGNEGFIDWLRPINAPFIHMGKHDICDLGFKLGIDYTSTWSCYKGGDIHCGRCGTCVERKEAFALAKRPDPTTYEDAAFEIAANQ